MLEGAFNGSVRIIGGPEAGIVCAVNSTQTGLCFIIRQCAMLKHPLANLNTKIMIIRLKRLHTLHCTSIMYGHCTRDADCPIRLDVLRTLVAGLGCTKSSMRSSTATGRLLHAVEKLSLFPVICGITKHLPVRYSIIREKSTILSCHPAVAITGIEKYNGYLLIHWL
jgi:hypothetical protein